MAVKKIPDFAALKDVRLLFKNIIIVEYYFNFMIGIVVVKNIYYENR